MPGRDGRSFQTDLEIEGRTRLTVNGQPSEEVTLQRMTLRARRLVESFGPDLRAFEVTVLHLSADVKRTPVSATSVRRDLTGPLKGLSFRLLLDQHGKVAGIEHINRVREMAAARIPRDLESRRLIERVLTEEQMTGLFDSARSDCQGGEMNGSWLCGFRLPQGDQIDQTCRSLRSTSTGKLVRCESGVTTLERTLPSGKSLRLNTRVDTTLRWNAATRSVEGWLRSASSGRAPEAGLELVNQSRLSYRVRAF